MHITKNDVFVAPSVRKVPQLYPDFAQVILALRVLEANIT